MAETALPSTQALPDAGTATTVPLTPVWRGWFAPRLLAVVGLGLIGLWVWLWVESAREDHLALGQSTWVPALSFLAGDFKVHIDHVARIQAAGIDPYHKFDDWVCGLYPYPPMIGRIFHWVVLFDPLTASRVWQAAIGSFLAAGCLVAWRTRRELKLDPIPLALMVGLVLFSSPALFVMERAQCDPLIIVPMIAATWLLRRKNGWADLVAGGVLGFTAWVKYYPGLAVVALISLGRGKAVAAFVVVAGLIGIVDYEGFRESVERGKQTMIAMTGPHRAVHSMKHSIVENWELFDFVKNNALVKIPGIVMAAALLLPAVVWVSRKVAKSADPGAVLFPYLLWLVAVATFGMPYSIDYNLTALPIATLSVWDRRDRTWIHLVIVASVVWSQPFWLPIDGQILLVLKLGAIYGVGAAIAARAAAVEIFDQKPAEFRLFRPFFARISGGSVLDSRRS